MSNTTIFCKVGQRARHDRILSSCSSSSAKITLVEMLHQVAEELHSRINKLDTRVSVIETRCGVQHDFHLHSRSAVK